jgi:hypothetical protein
METEAARTNLLHAVRLVSQALKTVGTYDARLWNACLDYFRSGDLSAFLDTFIEEIRSQLTRAFNQGARDVGVDPSEFTAADLAHLEGWINSEYNYVLSLAQAIQDLRTTNASLDKFRTAIRWRVGLWSNRFMEVLNEARIYFGGQVRLQWQLGSAEENCPTCSALNGLVAFATEWDQAQVRPQHPPNPHLKCEGWHCTCSLPPTNQRRSPRALNSILGIILNP